MALWHDGWLMDVYFDGLASGLQSGRPPFEATYKQEFWAYLEQDARRRVLFDRYLSGTTSRLATSLAEAVDEAFGALQQTTPGQDTKATSGPVVVRPGKCICDVGGGGPRSPLLLTLLSHYPAAKGLVFDLPEAAHDGSSQLAGAGVLEVDADEEEEEEEEEAVAGAATSMVG